MWRVLAGIPAKQKTDSEYYITLSRLHDDSFTDFANIISLDVKRTVEAMNSEDFSRKMYRILLNYAKFYRSKF